MGIDYFFDQFDYGIIVKNGFLPSRSFFRYCNELLHYYQSDDTILQISGMNLVNNHFQANSIYIFTHSFFGGAFATWRKKWIRFKKFIKIGDRIECDQNTARLVKFISIEATRNWQYKWMLFGIKHRYFSIQPRENLVRIIKKKMRDLSIIMLFRAVK